MSVNDVGERVRGSFGSKRARKAPVHTLVEPARSDERVSSPPEDVPFDASTDVVPVGSCHGSRINCSASALDLSGKGLVYILRCLGVQALGQHVAESLAPENR
jgi:hypothetical protein